MKKPISARSMHRLNDGESGALIDKLICDAIADIHQRSYVKGPRVVAINLILTPRDTSATKPTEISIDLDANPKFPKRHIATTMARLMPGSNEALFSPFSPDEPDQATIMDQDDDFDDAE